MSSAHITYSQRPEASAKNELAALASVYRFVLDCRKKEAATSPVSRPDDGTKVKEDSANEHRST